MADLDVEAPRLIPLSVPVSCWLCQLVFYLPIAQLRRIPHDSLMQVKCPDEGGRGCGNLNVFRRVPAPDYIVPGDSYDDQAGAYWGILGGPNLN